MRSGEMDRMGAGGPWRLSSRAGGDAVLSSATATLDRAASRLSASGVRSTCAVMTASIWSQVRERPFKRLPDELGSVPSAA